MLLYRFDSDINLFYLQFTFFIDFLCPKGCTVLKKYRYGKGLWRSCQSKRMEEEKAWEDTWNRVAEFNSVLYEHRVSHFRNIPWHRMLCTVFMVFTKHKEARNITKPQWKDTGILPADSIHMIRRKFVSNRIYDVACLVQVAINVLRYSPCCYIVWQWH